MWVLDVATPARTLAGGGHASFELEQTIVQGACAMSVSRLKRMFVAAAVMSAVSFAGTGVIANAQQGRKNQQDDKKQQDGKKRAQARQPQGQDQPRQAQQRLPQQRQQQLISQQQQRLAQYRDQLDQQQRLAQQQSAQLQRQNRTAQYGFQQQHIARLRSQQLSIQNARNYNYGGDPYFYTPPSYRYSRGGRYYETNQYGVDLLRQAVNYGYEEGFAAGQADRQDRWAFSYQDSYAYQDGNYGYGGFYVERDDYSYYFREGFRRGYEDGYYGRYQYGSYSNGRGSILGGVLSVIINFESIR
jgi:flagellar motor protein MotB